MTKYLMIGASAVALMALPAIAQTAAPPSPEKAARWNAPQTRADLEKKIAERFAAIDANKDGAITEAEIKAHAEARRAEGEKKMTEARTRMFESMDADKNGQVSRQEWDSHHAGMKAKWKERRETASADGKDRGAWMKGDRDGRKGHRMMHRGGHGWGGVGSFGGGFGGKWIETADANKDGRVTLAEAKAKPLARFDAADTNKDGTLSPEERKAAREAMRAERRTERGDS